MTVGRHSRLRRDDRKIRVGLGHDRPGVNTEACRRREPHARHMNMWSMSSYDDKLGLVAILPLGNATPDHVGMHRTPEMEKYASSIVALDVTNGDALVVPNRASRHLGLRRAIAASARRHSAADGSVVPAVAQATKRGEIFLLDRRDGKPVAEVQEKPVPQSAVPGEFTSPTQPFSVRMPHFRED